MNMIKKFSIAMVAAGSMATAFAESITFGVEIPPVASLIVRDGLIRSASVMQQAPATLPGATNTVGGFTVITNMPKWNLYFTLANNGNLISQSGTYIKSNHATDFYLPLGTAQNAAITAGRVWLKLPAVNQIKGKDGPATADLAYDAISSTANLAQTDGIINNTQNTLTAMLDVNGSTACTGAAACDDNGWIYATDQSIATFDVGTFLDNTNTIVGLAGTYTETLYITLVTAY